ncbi:MAG: DUF4399 domain-containing protein [Myxococcales bacterium]
MGCAFIDFSSTGRIGGWFGVGILVLTVGGLGVAEAEIPTSARPDDAQVYFISPADGDVLSSLFVVRFGLKGMGVAPAGMEKAETGHHHLVVDAKLPPSGLPIPADDHYRHFGKGQTEVPLNLSPGKHTLQLVLGDHLHIQHRRPVVSERISITVEK